MTKEKDTSAKTMQNLVAKAKNEKPPVSVKTRGVPERRLYSATVRIPRPTAERLQLIALERKTTLQQIFAVALDEWLRRENEGTFYPDGWEQ